MVRTLGPINVRRIDAAFARLDIMDVVSVPIALARDVFAKMGKHAPPLALPGADLGRDIEPIGQLEWRNYWVRVGEREGAMRIDAALRSMENVLEKSKKKIQLRALHLEKIRLGVPVTPVEDDSSSAGA